MSDVLQMSFSQMQALSQAFSTASNDLGSLNGNITNFLSTISSTIGNWITDSARMKSNAEGIQSSLTSVKNNTMGTWQGQQADKFQSQTYPAIESAMKAFITALDDFSNTLKSKCTDLEDTLTPINENVKNESTDCQDQSTWVSRYAQEHQDAENRN